VPYLDLSGASLAYDDDGTGPAVVLLHAGIADRRMWREQVGPLSVMHRVIRLDLRGYGESTLTRTPFAHHDDVVALLDHLGIQRAVLVGCSFGGAVAVDTALAYPDRVAGLALIGSALSGHEWSEEVDELWEALAAEVGTDDVDAMAEAEVRFWVVGPGRDIATMDPDLLDFAWRMDRRALAAEAALGQVDVHQLDPVATYRLGEVRPPTLVTAGGADVPDIRRLADRMAAEIPNAHRLPDIPDAAHLSPLEQPEAVNRIVLSFLGALRG
jgi:3-oxoadipate enol-lactonase